MFQLEGARDLSTLTPFEQIIAAIVGGPKTGKSNVAVTAPYEMPNKPQYQGIFVADFDGRLAAIAGKPHVVAKTYRNASYIDGRSWEEFQRDLGMIEYAKSQGKEIPATIVLDSMTYMSEAAMKYVTSQSPTDRREVKSGSFKVFVPKSYDAYKAEVAFILNTFQRIIELGSHLIVCFHERAEEAPDSTEATPRFTGKYTVNPPRASQYLALFNEVWRMNPDGSYKVQVKPDYKFTAGTTFKGLSDSEDPDIQKMIQKHLSNSGK